MKPVALLSLLCISATPYVAPPPPAYGECRTIEMEFITCARLYTHIDKQHCEDVYRWEFEYIGEWVATGEKLT